MRCREIELLYQKTEEQTEYELGLGFGGVIFTSGSYHCGDISEIINTV